MLTGLHQSEILEPASHLLPDGVCRREYFARNIRVNKTPLFNVPLKSMPQEYNLHCESYPHSVVHVLILRGFPDSTDQPSLSMMRICRIRAVHADLGSNALAPFFSESFLDFAKLVLDCLQC